MNRRIALALSDERLRQDGRRRPELMKIFISSVRHGLEAERDALPGLIIALGHEAIRFEDFTAQPVPSREACLRGVEESDVYLLLIGGSYGDPVFDTGLSPTEEEWNVARRRGLPILVFRKRGVELEHEQQAFVGRVEEFTGGRFRAAFNDTAGLQTEVVRAISELRAVGEPLKWSSLEQDYAAPWINEATKRSYSAAVFECHVITVAPQRRIGVRDLEPLGPRLTKSGRELGFFGVGDAVEDGNDATRAWAARDAPHRERRGVSLSRDGTVSVWAELPSDGLGQIFDPRDISMRIHDALLLAYEVAPNLSDVVTAAVGVGPLGMLVEGLIDDLGRRNSAALGSTMGSAARVEPEDSFPRGALVGATQEIAEELTARLRESLRAER
jgi:hypothetical protein